MCVTLPFTAAQGDKDHNYSRCIDAKIQTQRNKGICPTLSRSCVELGFVLWQSACRAPWAWEAHRVTGGSCVEGVNLRPAADLGCFFRTSSALLLTDPVSPALVPWVSHGWVPPQGGSGIWLVPLLSLGALGMEDECSSWPLLWEIIQVKCLAQYVSITGPQTFFIILINNCVSYLLLLVSLLLILKIFKNILSNGHEQLLCSLAPNLKPSLGHLKPWVTGSWGGTLPIPVALSRAEITDKTLPGAWGCLASLGLWEQGRVTLECICLQPAAGL